MSVSRQAHPATLPRHHDILVPRSYQWQVCTNLSVNVLACLTKPQATWTSSPGTATHSQPHRCKVPCKMASELEQLIKSRGHHYQTDSTPLLCSDILSKKITTRIMTWVTSCWRHGYSSHSSYTRIRWHIAKAWQPTDDPLQVQEQLVHWSMTRKESTLLPLNLSFGDWPQPKMYII